jgi:hypothetical protein
MQDHSHNLHNVHDGAGLSVLARAHTQEVRIEETGLSEVALAELLPLNAPGFGDPLGREVADQYTGPNGVLGDCS